MSGFWLIVNHTHALAMSDVGLVKGWEGRVGKIDGRFFETEGSKREQDICASRRADLVCGNIQHSFICFFITL